MMRVDVVIDQYGLGENVYPIYRLEISNIGTVRSEGFGNDYCNYHVRKMKHNNETQQQYGYPEWEVEAEGTVIEHNRRDGAIELVRKAAELFKEVDMG